MPNEVHKKIKDLMSALRARGERPYFIENGGCNVLGMLGCVLAVQELKSQAKEMGISPDYIVLPTGTATTQSGLILGKHLFDFDAEIIGISVSRGKDRCVKEIRRLLDNTAVRLGIKYALRPEEITVCDEYIGKGYGALTDGGRSAVRLLAQEEGLIIDPIYNAKAFCGMLDLIHKAALKGTIVYLNTGGLPNLFMRKFRGIVRGEE